ncbi:MAG: YifB family Mg chelatase-like AAA ATPase [Patescibacteria group bacterium]|nr:YifB family Mg chelatase-like AAA ATPase [Patescibacteria group bacterium]MDE1945732.1 YifB family Mg chelatase-like AAA ATPase [Patescibacteria group bacterium]
MSFAKTYAAQTVGLGAEIVDVEVDLSKGLHAFAVVGLPDKNVEESRDRVSAAIKNSGLASPKSQNQKVVVSLAPADLKKEGPVFDLAIALAYLLAHDDIGFDPEKKLFLGELSLDGLVRGISGALPIAAEAKKKGFTEIFVPKENAREAALISGIAVYGVSTLAEILEHLNEKKPAAKEKEKPRKKISRAPETNIVPESADMFAVDFSEIKGQETAKRGMEIAAAGGHNIAMYGPPGTGKTMLAKAFSGILPPLSSAEILEITAIHSIAGTLKDDIVARSPVRSPHHTASYVSIVGGGVIPKPGEVTLAHRGVLFLDEFPEFDRKVIDTLREPLEEGEISISRARGTHTFPANFILIAAMNPCPCGNAGSKTKSCICKPHDLARYERKISGPIIDRIDLWTEVSQIDYEKLSAGGAVASESKYIKSRVAAARKIQAERFAKAGRNIKTNSEMAAKDIEKLIPLSPAVKEILNASAKKLNLSARAYHRVIKLARTIADLEHENEIAVPHILEALQYRPKR